VSVVRARGDRLDAFHPITVLDLDVEGPTPDTRASSGPARVLVRRAGVPVGVLDVEPSGDGCAIAEALCAAAAEFQTEPPGPPPPGAAAASLVIATKDREASLARCLRSVRAADHRALEVIVVDNAPSDGATRRLVTELGRHWSALDYEIEPTPGASLARNSGAARAANEIVLFVDDDVEVDPAWASVLSGSFADDRTVQCVTGLVMAAELETAPQLWFEDFGGFTKGFSRRKFDLDRWRDPTRYYPYKPWIFGSSNNCAVSRQTFLDLGGFDERMGPGRPTKSGEDLDLFLRYLHAGWRILYEPRALVWHHHRGDYPALRRQVHDYGVGLAALFTKLLLSGRPFTTDILRLAPEAVRSVLRLMSEADNDDKSATYPPELTRDELIGMLAGPWAWLRAWHDARRDVDRRQRHPQARTTASQPTDTTGGLCIPK
jgi:GT2 family glycosyltransferase